MGCARDARVRRWQRWLTPVWRRVGGGCHLDRDIAAILHDSVYRSDDLRADHAEGARWLSYTFEGTPRPA